MKNVDGGEIKFLFSLGYLKISRIKIPNSTLIKIVCQLKIIEDGKIKLLFSFGYLKILEINVLKLLICGLKNIEDGKDGKEIRFLFFYGDILKTPQFQKSTY